MNDNTQRYGSILLVAMLVLSMSVAFVGVGAADSTADLNDGDRYWVGQTLEYENTTISGDSDLSITSAEVVTDDTDDSTFVTELNANNGNISIDTSNFESDAYLLEYDYENSSDDSTGSESVAFEVSEQTLDVEPADVRVDNDGDSETTFEFDSNRNSFEVNVSTDGLTDEELASVFSTGTASYSTSDVEDGNLTVDATDDVDVDFQDIDADSYDFSFEVVDTDASATTSVTVADPGDAVVEFAEPVNSFSEGDSTELTVNFNDTDSADVVIGDEEEVGYELNFTVEDTEENGEVTVVFDSYVAGESDDVVKVHEDSEGDVTVNNRTTLTDRKLSPSEYDMSAFVTSTGDETDVGTLNIVERTSTGVSTVVAPGGETINDYEDIENATESTTVASGDYVAYKVEMTGVYGFLEDGADLSEAEDESAGAEDTPGFYMTIEKDAPNANEEVDLSDADVYTNEDDGVFYVVFDVDNSDFDVDSDYESELVISEDNPYVEEEEDEESHTNTLSTEERDTEFVGYNADDVLEFEEGDELEVTAETNVAEGTESTLTVRMTGDNPTIETYDVVAEDGEFTTTADIEGLSVGTEFTVQLSGETDREDAVIVESTTTDDDDTDTTDDDTDTTDDDTDTTDDDTDTTDDDTDTNNTDTDTNNTDGDTTEDDTPGFGALVALIAILGAVGLAHRRSD
jgi:PGF-CTERM protein